MFERVVLHMAGHRNLSALAELVMEWTRSTVFLLLFLIFIACI